MASNVPCFVPPPFAEQAEELRKIIESNEKRANKVDIGSYSYGDFSWRADAYEAIRGLMPEYKGTGNPLEDKMFIAAMQAKYSQAEDPFTAFIDAAKKNLAPKYKGSDGRLDDGKYHLLKHEESRYTKNIEKNKNTANENSYESLPFSQRLSNKLDEIGKTVWEYSVGLAKPTGVSILGVFPAITTMGTADGVGRLGENIYSKNPLLVKLTDEIARNKEQLTMEMPDKSILIETMHERLLKNIEKMHRRANSAESALTHFERKRVEEEGLKVKYTESDFSRELARNSINVIKDSLNDSIKYGLGDLPYFDNTIYIEHDDTEKLIVSRLIPKDLDFASRMMADIREKNGIAVGKNVSLDDVKAQAFNHACVKPASFQQSK